MTTVKEIFLVGAGDIGEGIMGAGAPRVVLESLTGEYYDTPPPFLIEAVPVVDLRREFVILRDPREE